jgi:pyruvate,orthophosphate dikinase
MSDRTVADSVLALDVMSLNDLSVDDREFSASVGASPLATTRLGGKGANLIVMKCTLGLPVPPAFVIGVEVYKRWRDQGWPKELDAILHARVRDLELQLGRSLGDARNPLLLSVRSSGPVSMPGMMETVLNVGANEVTIAGLAQHSGNRFFAYDTWRRFCRMYAKTVLAMDVPEAEMNKSLHVTAEADVLADTKQLQIAARDNGTPIPSDPWLQLRTAIEAVFASWNSERAKFYRRRENISDDLGTAVVVQAMVFGNAGATSGTGVAFTRDPATGAATPCGDFLLGAQGEDVVAGTHRTLPLAGMQQVLPAPYQELLATLQRLERHYRDLCDVEFTVEAGRLWILQTRIGKRSPLASVRMAVEMAEDPGFPLERSEALQRISGDDVAKLQAQRSIRRDAVHIAVGSPASPGVATGVICLDSDRAAQLSEKGVAVILVRPTTSPEDVHGMIAAAGVLTAAGGMVSHAAVIARGWGIPAVTGAATIQVLAEGLRIGTLQLREGELITLDGSTGHVYVGDQQGTQHDDVPELATLRRWCSELGVELGQGSTQAATTAGVVTVQNSTSNPTRTSTPLLPSTPPRPFDVLRAIQLKGMASITALAEIFSTSADMLQPVIDQLGAYVVAGQRGFRVTPAGRQWLDAQLALERQGVDAAAVAVNLGEFTTFDIEFKGVVTSWQLRSVDGQQVPNDHADAQHDATVLRQLGDIHARVLQLVAAVAKHVPRLQHFSQRFARAHHLLSNGDHSMVASPLKDSYHSIWFELHEELLQLCSRSRASLEHQ